jgi:hypothetical protein
MVALVSTVLYFLYQLFFLPTAHIPARHIEVVERRNANQEEQKMTDDPTKRR